MKRMDLTPIFLWLGHPHRDKGAARARPTAGQAPEVHSSVLLDNLSPSGKLKVVFQISFFLKRHL